jgi:hypothetical protein
MKRYINILNAVWRAVLAFDVALSLIGFIVVYFKVTSPIIEGKVNLYCNFLAMAIIILLVVYADKLTKRKIKKVRNEKLANKLIKYKSIYLNQLCCYGLISLVAIIFMILLMQIGYIVFCVFSILLIVLAKVREAKVKYDLSLTEEELSQFNHIKFNK